MKKAALSAIVLLAACASAPAPQTLYLLRSEPAQQSARVDAPVAVGLGRVEVAPYLAQSGIVVETEPGQVQVARLHHWAEPLDAGLRSLLRSELSDALGYEVSAGPGRSEWAYEVDVQVDLLHGSMDGSAVIDASYEIAPRQGGGEGVEYRFASSAPLPRPGYPGLVDAEVELTRQLAQAIAASLREIGK